MIIERFQKQVFENPHKIALVADKNYSYLDLDAQSNRYVSKWQLKPASKIVVAVKPGPELYIILLALLKSAAVPVLVDPAMGFGRFVSCAASVYPQGIVTRLGLWPLPFTKRAADKQLCAVNFTTGSTGPAKAVLVTSSMLDATLEAVQRQYEYGPETVTYSTLSLFGFLGLFVGAKVLFQPRSEATHVFTSPAFLKEIAWAQFSDLKHVVCGGAGPLTADIPKLSENIRFHVTYGATESLLMASTTDYQPGLLGYPVPGLDLKLIDQEICVNAPWVSKQPDKTWHQTGDLGYFDTHGQLWSLGRLSEVVHTAKGPLYTTPVENLYNQHPKVYRSALVGIGPKGSQKPVVCIEALENCSPEELLPISPDIQEIRFFNKFPVDIRHRSKIKRGELCRTLNG